MTEAARQEALEAAQNAPIDTLRSGAVAVLRMRDPWAKAALSLRLAEAWFSGDLALGPPAAPPDEPGRPERPELIDPRDAPRRGPGTEAGRIALIHAVAHIELNAIDLHWDACARFADTELPRGYYDDWARAAAEESKHFQLLSARLEAKGAHYGALPAHAGLWRSALATKDDILGRLAVVPMVLEARGLDVTPGMIDLFRKVKDEDTVSALQTIYAEEVGHVAYGSKWFHFLCGRHNLDPKPVFHELVRRYFGGRLKPPFNDEKRAEAGLPLDFYWPLADEN